MNEYFFKKARHLSLVAFAFLLPWQARWIISQGMHPVTGSPFEWRSLSIFVTEVLVLLCLVLALSSRESRSHIVAIVRSRSARPWLLLLLWACLSILWSHESLVALQWCAMLLLATVASVLWYLDERPRDLVCAWLFSMAMQVTLAFWQVAYGNVAASTVLGMAAQQASGPSSVVEWFGGRVLRAYGTLPHPNILGGFLACALVFAFVDLARATTARRRATLSVFATAMGLGLFFTFSRSAWLAAFFGVLFVAWRHRNATQIRVALFCVVASAAFVASTGHEMLRGRVTGVGRLEQRSTNERVTSLRDGLLLALAHPILGLGAGSVIDASSREASVTREPPHAVPLVVFVQLGLVGLALFLWGLARLAFAARGTDAMALLLTLCVLGLFDHYLWTLWPGLLLGAWMISVALVSPLEPRGGTDIVR